MIDFIKMPHILFLIPLFLILFSGNANAYVGPGAGFAFLSSFLVLFVAILLALLTILIWPLRAVFFLFKKKGLKNTRINKAVILGLDGLDPGLIRKFMERGKLPNFEKIAQEGSFLRLKTTMPAISPVAWSSFSTGCYPGKHRIYDFFTRDTHTYLPTLSSAFIGKSSKLLRLGRWVLPLGKPSIRLLRKSAPFWKLLGDKGCFCHILRVPITFPPEKFRGACLSAMCTPDIRGTQGTFTYYTSRKENRKAGENWIKVMIENNSIRSFIYGPNFSEKDGTNAIKIPFSININKEANEALVKVQNKKINLKPGIYSPWVELTFKAGPFLKVRGICRFLVRVIEPDFEMYMTPINLSPHKPSLPISHPFYYAVYLAKIHGDYATLGLAEDTIALNERVIDEEQFLEQCYQIYKERERQFLYTLENMNGGLCTCVFDTTDRVQHMFFRCLDDNHPANMDKDTKRYKEVIEDLYKRMDALLGKALERLNDEDVILVMSDHGFKPFKWGVNLNSWLYQNGYLKLKQGMVQSSEWLRDVDWSETKAYAIGLAGIFLNIKGREVNGIVSKEESKGLKDELIQKLTGLKDDRNGRVTIDRVYDSSEYNGPYVDDAPDLIVGYHEGYRASWDGVTGKVGGNISEDNTRSWSGDHSIDPELVPGVLFCNRRIEDSEASIVDIAPTILNLFGVEIPEYMDGKSLKIDI